MDNGICSKSEKKLTIIKIRYSDEIYNDDYMIFIDDLTTNHLTSIITLESILFIIIILSPNFFFMIDH